MSHTPTPWCVEPLALGAIEDAEGNSVAQTQPRQALAAGKKDAEREANAAFIVRAVNSHDRLVEALRALVDAADAMSWATNSGTADAALADARAALEGL